MFMIDYKEPGQWYWLVTAVLLAAGVSGYPISFLAAIGLTIVQLSHFAIRERSITAFPVQVRFWYLILLLAALSKPLQMIYWLPTIGTWIWVIFGYCTMARCVTLFPWNRSEPFSAVLLRRKFLSRPVRGNIMQGLQHSKSDAYGQTNRLSGFCPAQLKWKGCFGKLRMSQRAWFARNQYR
jgi:hypothetical protein